VHLQASRRRGRVDAFSEADEADTQRLQFLEQQHQVAEVASEAIETPADQRVEAPSLGVPYELVERGPALLRAAHAVVDVLTRDRPAAGPAVLGQFGDLVLGVLVGGGNPRVEAQRRVGIAFAP
jgi:hypothetical protein